MAERERLTNKERRAVAREERRRKEAEEAARKKRGQLRSGLITFAIVGVVAAVVLQALLGGAATFEDTILVSSSEADDAFEAAGCEVLADRQPLPDRSHFAPNQVPNLDDIYTDTRPTHSGPHVGPQVAPVQEAASRQISEAATTHNLEHGAIITWWDPDDIDGSTASEIGSWAADLNNNGFLIERAGTGMLTSPYDDPGISSGKSIALRAWGTAWDCDEWNETVANAFVIENYGTHGIGPERNFAPYPTEVMIYEDLDVDDTSEDDAPTDGTQTPPEDLTDEELEELEGDAPADGDDGDDDGDDDDAGDPENDDADDAEGDDS